MSKRSTKQAASTSDAPKVIRCAIYTRKSTEEGLEQAFNTLDAQRESGEAYVAAQRHEGWTCLPDRYDDGGFSGGNLERPAMRRLLADIEAGKVDCVVVYKVDRLSRSLMDFSGVMQTFDAHRVSFVSVTQQFNTTHSMGRLTLNILLSFAQFEREIISERTRDKMAAARRRGKFAGGKPLLGYDLLSSPAGPKLIVNEDEAHRVRSIFALYLEHHALIATLKAIDAKGWCNKEWVTKKGTTRGGRPFDKMTLYRLLTNRTYTGVVTHAGETYPGEHAAIVDTATFAKVGALLTRNGRTNGAAVKNRHGALLRGLLHCGCCDCSMVHSYTSKGAGKGTGKAGKLYRYYVCLSAQKRGWHTCQTKSVPAGEIERFVVEQIRGIGSDPQVLDRTIRQMRAQAERGIEDHRAGLRALDRELARHTAAMKKLLASPEDGASMLPLQEKIEATTRKVTQANEDIFTLQNQIVDPAEVATALTAFDPVWEQLSAKERCRVIQLLVERVDYDGAKGSVSVTFRPGGVKQLAREQHHHEEAA
jgi:site-specific DNA recombinase